MDINKYQEWLNERIMELRTAQSIKTPEDRLNGSIWDFVILGCLIEVVSKLNSERTGKSTFQVVRKLFDERLPKYRNIKYEKPVSANDLPEQLYMVLRCGLVHGLSLRPDEKVRNSGRYKPYWRENTLTLWHRGNHLHINRIIFNGQEWDRVNIDYDSLLEDIQKALNNIFEDGRKNNEKGKIITDFIMENPGVGFSPGTWIKPATQVELLAVHKHSQ
ncbi:hypothetical protein [Gluconacetobacter sacchari]|uniref:hypothetical protein n=1 Tax=Gluconacetobacter sacchari TaxID=92759 RepID=UPI0022301607|nr:hypothetical protein [Gluconacetobacter sacchari]